MCTCEVERKSLFPLPTQLFCRKSDSAGALPIPFTQGLGGSLVQSTLLTVIFTNPTVTLHYYCSRLAFATTTRFRSGYYAAKSALIVDVARDGARFEISVCFRDKARLSTLSLPVSFRSSAAAVASCHSAFFGGLSKGGNFGTNSL